jgi:hypothetical protein
VPYNPLAYTYDLLNRVTSRNADTFDYNARSEVTAADIGATISRYAYDNMVVRQAKLGASCGVEVPAE